MHWTRTGARSLNICVHMDATGSNKVTLVYVRSLSLIKGIELAEGIQWIVGVSLHHGASCHAATLSVAVSSHCYQEHTL